MNRENEDDMVLSLDEHYLLSLVLEQMEQLGSAVPALKFRASHREQLKLLDDLEAGRWLKRDNDRYTVLSIILPLIDSESARRLMASIELIYAALREKYFESQQDPVKVINVAATTGLHGEQVLAILRLMTDCTVWSAGWSFDIGIENAYVMPAEKVIEFDSYASLAKEVRSWWIWPVRESALAEAAEDQIVEHKTGLTGVSTSIIRAWGPARVCLEELRFDQIKQVAGLAGLDLREVAHLVQQKSVNATKGQLLASVDAQLRDMNEQETTRFLTILIEELLRRSPGARGILEGYLNRLGWSFVEGTLIPIALFDVAVLNDTPDDAHADLLRAAQRLRDGDLNGAITSAAGAVDAAVSQVYLDENLGDPMSASFQERCKRALTARGVLPELERQLSELGWPAKEYVPFKRNLEQAFGRGAYILQTLRSQMGDVHGNKPIVRSLVFDAIRWAELLVGALVVKSGD